MSKTDAYPDGSLKYAWVLDKLKEEELNVQPKQTSEIQFIDYFEAKIIISDTSQQIQPGYSPVIHVGTNKVSCKFSEIKATIDRDNNVLEEYPKFVKNGDICIVNLVPLISLRVETLSDRFDVIDGKKKVAEGFVTNVFQKNKSKAAPKKLEQAQEKALENLEQAPEDPKEASGNLEKASGNLEKASGNLKKAQENSKQIQELHLGEPTKCGLQQFVDSLLNDEPPERVLYKKLIQAIDENDISIIKSILFKLEQFCIANNYVEYRIWEYLGKNMNAEIKPYAELTILSMQKQLQGFNGLDIFFNYSEEISDARYYISACYSYLIGDWSEFEPFAEILQSTQKPLYSNGDMPTLIRLLHKVYSRQLDRQIITNLRSVLVQKQVEPYKLNKILMECEKLLLESEELQKTADISEEKIWKLWRPARLSAKKIFEMTVVALEKQDTGLESFVCELLSDMDLDAGRSVKDETSPPALQKCNIQ